MLLLSRVKRRLRQDCCDKVHVTVTSEMSTIPSQQDADLMPRINWWPLLRETLLARIKRRLHHPGITNSYTNDIKAGNVSKSSKFSGGSPVDGHLWVAEPAGAAEEASDPGNRLLEALQLAWPGVSAGPAAGWAHPRKAAVRLAALVQPESGACIA